MLAVARRKAPNIEWRDGRAESLPFEANSFDTVVCQFGLMFFEDRRTAIQEIMRVLRQGGRLAVAVWESIEKTPGDSAVANLIQRLYGEGIAEGWLAVLRPFVASAGAVVVPAPAYIAVTTK
jgi:ubiquinone/menaquinone biosynthesis C-methylase UbiE